MTQTSIPGINNTNPERKKKKKIDPPTSTKTHSLLANPIATQATQPPRRRNELTP
jgi:hypothetical protein